MSLCQNCFHKEICTVFRETVSHKGILAQVSQCQHHSAGASSQAPAQASQKNGSTSMMDLQVMAAKVNVEAINSRSEKIHELMKNTKRAEPKTGLLAKIKVE